MSSATSTSRSCATRSTRSVARSGTRFDFKGVTVDLTQAKDELILITDDEHRAAAVKDLIESKAIRRSLSLKIFDWGKVEEAGGNKVRQRIGLRRGLSEEIAKKITKLIRDEFPKVKSQIQGDAVRVSGKSRDDLQRVIARLRELDLAGPAAVRELPLTIPDRGHIDRRSAVAMTELDAAASRRPATPTTEAHAATPTHRPKHPSRAGSTERRPPARAGAPLDAEPTMPAPDAAPERRAEAAPEPETATTRSAEPPSRVGRAEPRPSRARRADARARRGARARLEPAAAEGPRTVGRFIADALRAAGVRYAFTVPGESFLGLLDAFEGAGIRVIATRHEGAAAFMAEAHGQLTGRPAVCLGTRAVGGANLAIGIHTARQNSTPMFAVVGQVERALLGREAFQEIDQVATLGGLAKWAAEPHAAAEVAATMAEAVRQALGGRPGPVLLSLPEDLLDEPMPDDARVDSGRPAGRARHRRRDPRGHRAPRLGRRPVILAGGGVLRARTSTELTRFAELLQVPIIAAWRRADVISNDHPLYLGMAGLRCRADRSASGSTPPMPCSSSAPGSTSRRPSATRCRAPACRWAHVDLEPGEAGGLHAPDDQPSRPTPRRSSRRPTSGSSAGPSSTPSVVATRQANNRDDRAAWEASRRRCRRRGTGRASIPAGRSRRSGGSCPTTRS